MENFRWLLLIVPPQYSKVSWGPCSLISHLHVLSKKNLQKTLDKYFFTITWQSNFFLAWFDLSRAFNSRIGFGKTLVAFDFDEKLTQIIANYVNTMCQKTFLACTLQLIECFQFQDIIWKAEDCCVSRIIKLKIWRWKFRFCFCSAFVYFANFLLSLM